MSPAPAGLGAAVRAGAARLASAGVPSPDADAVALAGHLLGVSDGEVRRLVALGSRAPGGFTDRYDVLLAERGRRVPLQHLTGRAHFRRLTLGVGPGVFVPRPETELLAGFGIAWACEKASEPEGDESLGLTFGLAGEPASGLAPGPGTGRATGWRSGPAAAGRPVVVDLCSGSGAVAFAVADEVPVAQVHAVELAAAALAWARLNQERLGLPVNLVQGDATADPATIPELAGLTGLVDVVLANPPYIPAAMQPLDPEVRDHDPPEALYGGSDDGLRIPLAVAATAAALLRRGGRFAMEHADVQGEQVVTALRHTGWWDEVEDHADLAGRPRCVTATRR